MSGGKRGSRGKVERCPKESAMISETFEEDGSGSTRRGLPV